MSTTPMVAPPKRLVTPRPHDPRAARPFKIESVRVGGDAFGIEESTLFERPFAKLTVFTRQGAEGGRAFLVVPPLAGAFPVLLRDLVVALLRQSGAVAVADWLDARFVPASAGRFGFDENVNYLIDMVRALGPDLHVVAVCQAVTPALAAVSLVAADEPAKAPRSLILVGGPIDPAANPTRVVKLLASRSLQWLDDNLIAFAPAGSPGEGRRVYPKERQFGSFLSYLDRHMFRGGELFWKLLIDDGEDPWQYPFWTLVASLMDLPAEYFLEDVQNVFHKRAIMVRQLRVAGRLVDPRALRSTALMTVEGAEDDLAAPGQTSAAHAVASSIPAAKRNQLLVPSSGHFSLFHGGVCRRRVVPAIVAFIDKVA